MSLTKRFRLFFGILVVLGIVVALLINMSYSMSRVSSLNAKLNADTYTVGTSYSGRITEQYVQIGDEVVEGQKLFSIMSDVLSSEITGGQVSKERLSFDLDENNNIILTATGNGTINDIMYLKGAFVPANKEIATITRTSSLYVEASYQLPPPDYARVDNGSIVAVTLPNNQVVEAKVFFIAIESVNKVPVTVIKARIGDVSKANKTALTVGTPVTTELHLNGTTLFKTFKTQFDKLFKSKA